MKMYSKKVIQYFLHPKNMGEIKDPDGIGKAGNPICGDEMLLYIKVKNNKLTNIKFQTLGCAAAIATSSLITELAKGKTLEEAERITRDDIADELGGLPSVKMHCSNLAAEALHKAIEDYKSKKGKSLKGESKMAKSKKISNKKVRRKVRRKVRKKVRKKVRR